VIQSLAAIAAARPGDPVHLIRDGDRWRIENAQGQTLARFSRAFAPPEGTTFLRGEVAAILNWRREDGDEDYHHLLRRDGGKWSCQNWCSKALRDPTTLRQIATSGGRLNCKAFVFTLVLRAESTTMVAVTPQDEAQRRSLINLRVTPRERDVIDRAAAR
jgi:hypothetical protein